MAASHIDYRRKAGDLIIRSSPTTPSEILLRQVHYLTPPTPNPSSILNSPQEEVKQSDFAP
jgi:hypothetical protein